MDCLPRKTKSDSPEALPSQDRLRIAVSVQPRLFCEALSRQLGLETGLLLVGGACDPSHLEKLVSKEKPQVLVLGYEGLGPTAENVIHSLRRAVRGTRILVLATRSGDETIERVLRAGASGLFGKDLAIADLVRAIRAVASGEIWANRRAASSVLESLAGPSTKHQKSRLTTREQEIADACGQGLRNKDIAKLLGISEKTVKAHLNTIFRKLEVDNRFALGLRILDQLHPKT